MLPVLLFVRTLFLAVLLFALSERTGRNPGSRRLRARGVRARAPRRAGALGRTPGAGHPFHLAVVVIAGSLILHSPSDLLAARRLRGR